MAENPGRNLTLWRLIDGKPGHEKQTLGLTRALGRLTATHCLNVPIAGLKHPLLAWMKGSFPPGDALPNPDLILAAGHATHIPALAARRARGGRVVVLMRPSLPLFLFDLCLIPRHDVAAASARVFVTLGALNTVLASADKAPDQGLILIGGVSPHFHWDNASVVAQVREIARRESHITWTLTTSRRTPADFIAQLRARTPDNLSIVPAEQTTPDWLETRLSTASWAWVSEDSVSMVYEALSAGASVGLLTLPPSGDSRVARGIQQLVDEARVTTYARWSATHVPPPAGQVINEAERCARHLLSLWFNGSRDD